MVRNILIRILLIPFALLYGLGVAIRNLLYQWNLLKSIEFSLPVIGIGNLTVGGAGKTPHTEYLIKLLSPYIQLATLSRGYGRKTKGFLLAQEYHSAVEIGDEPLQFFRKFPEVVVSVSESRGLGIPQLLSKRPEVQTILLDDVFQHRAVQPGLNLLLTEYHKPFTDDFILPVGRLREWPAGAQRADAIIVTKCPIDSTRAEREAVGQKVRQRPDQKIFYSFYRYGRPYNIFNPTLTSPLESYTDVLMVSAIAQTDQLIQFLEAQELNVRELSFEDHHKFTSYEVANMIRIFQEMESDQKLFLTTEKDAMRMELHKGYFLEHNIQVFALPVEVSFFSEQEYNFNRYVKDFLLDFEI
jgi:tetraacyldisaccharide 4'-kinase